MPWAAVSTYWTVPSSILMPNRLIAVPPAAAEGGSAVIASTRPNPGRTALGATTPGAPCCTTTVGGGAVTTGAGACVTTTGAGAGFTGSELAQAANTATAASDNGK